MVDPVLETRTADPCDFLTWDSEFWGFPVAQLRSNTLVFPDLADIDRWCQEQSIVCLYFLATFDDPKTVGVAEAGGFQLTDARVTLGRKAEPLLSLAQPVNLPGFSIRPITNSDIASLQRIAAVSHRDSRFFFDLHFPRAKCEMLYARWIAESCSGYADRVLVGDVAGEPVGYITCHAPESRDQAGRIGLVGVAPEFHGHGIGRELVQRALEWFAGEQVGMVTVATQGRNIAAQALYQRCGFVTRSQELWYHKWFRLPDQETA